MNIKSFAMNTRPFDEHLSFWLTPLLLMNTRSFEEHRPFDEHLSFGWTFVRLIEHQVLSRNARPFDEHLSLGWTVVRLTEHQVLSRNARPFDEHLSFWGLLVPFLSTEATRCCCWVSVRTCQEVTAANSPARSCWQPGSRQVCAQLCFNPLLLTDDTCPLS